jgi:hypothetical protein
MKAAIIISGIAIAALALLISCANLPSGIMVGKTYDLSGFTAIKANSAFKCVISRADEYSVVATIDKNLVDAIQIEVADSTLSITLKPGFAYLTPRTVTIGLPALEALSLNGASKAIVSGFDSPQETLALDLNGASFLDWSGGDVGDCVLLANGASKASFDGFKSARMRADLNGASKVSGKAGTSAIGILEILANGASSMAFDVSEKASGSMDGASSFFYGLSPDVSGISKRGASSIRSR